MEEEKQRAFSKIDFLKEALQSKENEVEDWHNTINTYKQEVTDLRDKLKQTQNLLQQEQEK